MNKKSTNRFFSYYDELSVNITDSDFEMAKEFLLELGLDTEKIKADGVNGFKKAAFLSKASITQSNDESLIQKLQNRIRESLEKNAKLAEEILQNALYQKKASFHFRNLEKWSEDEIRDVFNDIELINLLEELEDMEE